LGNEACGNIVVDEVYGVKVCVDTGEVLEEGLVDEGADWRAYTPEERVSRARASGRVSPEQGDFGVGALLGGVNLPGSVKAVGVRRVRVDRGVRKVAKMSKAWEVLEKDLNAMSAMLYNVVRGLGLSSDVHRYAGYLLRRVVASGLHRGRSREAVVSACLYVACRRYRVPVGFRELYYYVSGGGTEEGYREAVRVYRDIVRFFDIEVGVTGIESYVVRVASVLKVPERVLAEALELARRVRESGVASGRSPMGVAGAIVYLVALRNGVKVSQKDVAKVVGVTEVTIRNRVREIVRATGYKIEL